MFRLAQQDDLTRILEIDMKTHFEDLVILGLKQGICGN